MGAKSERVGRSLWQEDSHLKTRIGEGDIRACWWLALARRRLSEELCWWEKIQSALVFRFGRKAVIRRSVLVGAKSERLGHSPWRKGCDRKRRVGGSQIPIKS